MAFSEKSRDEIEKLKQTWLLDGIWDIEKTEGFEAHHDELLAFRIDAEKARAEKFQQKQLGEALARAQLVRDINDGLGLNNLMLAERLLAMQDRMDKQAQLIALFHSAICEISSSFRDELAKNEVWAGVYEELKTLDAVVRYV